MHLQLNYLFLLMVSLLLAALDYTGVSTFDILQEKLYICVAQQRCTTTTTTTLQADSKACCCIKIVVHCFYQLHEIQSFYLLSGLEVMDEEGYKDCTRSMSIALTFFIFFLLRTAYCRLCLNQFSIFSELSVFYSSNAAALFYLLSINNNLMSPKMLLQ